MTCTADYCSALSVFGVTYTIRRDRGDYDLIEEHLCIVHAQALWRELDPLKNRCIRDFGQTRLIYQSINEAHC